MILSIVLEDLELKFTVLNNPLAELWLERMAIRDQYPLDDPDRFYGFDSYAENERVALEKINHCIGQIQARHPELRNGQIKTVQDQDSLNYWHHVFETHHGLLGREDRTNKLTPILAELNVAVHRCESIARGDRPRFVCTWYGLPKTKTLPMQMMSEYGTLNPKFGSVCLNYAEIGKTLEDLTQDRDNYISDSAFQPFNHYSADFNVRMHEETLEYASEKIMRMQHYYNQHRQFFIDRGFENFQDPRLLPLRFPVAELIEIQPREQLMQEIAQRQHITQVTLQ